MIPKRALLTTLFAAALTPAADASAMTLDEAAAIQVRAKGGDDAAQMLLGIAYERGDGGLPRDGKLAVQWLERSALQGNAFAEAELGDIYDEGRILPLNATLAADWRQSAARRGDADSQLKLGKMYLEGRGVSKDIEVARRWLEQAAAAGKSEASYLLAHLEHAEIGSAKGDAGSRAPFEDDPYSAYGNAKRLLRFLAADFGRTVDRPLSPKAIEALARDGDVEAQLLLAHHFETGQRGEPRQLLAALHWYKSAADLGSVEAMRQLARIYDRGGPGVLPDALAAREWIKRAEAAAQAAEAK